MNNTKKTVLDTMPMLKAIINAHSLSSDGKMAGRLVCLAETDSTSPRIIFKTREEVKEGEAEAAFTKIYDRLAEGSRPELGFQIRVFLHGYETNKKLTVESFENFYSRLFARGCFYSQFDEPAERQEQTVMNRQPLAANQQSTKGKDNSLLPLIMFLFILFLASLYYC